MPNFVSTSALLRKKYEERKHDIVHAAPTPVSDICNSCWYQAVCIARTLVRTPPRTCCVFELFGDRGTNEATVEEVVKFTCDVKCEQRRKWPVDTVPHNAEYCENSCPVSRHIMQTGPARVTDVPYEEY